MESVIKKNSVNTRDRGEDRGARARAGTAVIPETLCPHSEFCGGCIHQGQSYEEQLTGKEEEVLRLFKNAGLSPERFDPISGCPEEYRFAYRNKMEYTFGDLVKGGELTLGMHRRKMFMSVVTVDHCQLVDPDFNRILRCTLDFCIARAYPKYHKKTHTGLLRNLIIRKGQRTNELLVNIVTSSQADFDEVAWTKELLALPLGNKIVGIMHTLNDGIADAVKCDELRVLYGRDYYMEEIFGLKFRVNIFSFFQTNVEAVERLYSRAIDLIDDFSGKNVLDLYCGTGTISQVMALKAGHVLGIELVPESVESARRNAAINGLANCEFACGDVFEVLDSLDFQGFGARSGAVGASSNRTDLESDGAVSTGAESVGAGSASVEFADRGIVSIKSIGSETVGAGTDGIDRKQPDVIVVDPPRAGMTPNAVDKIVSYGVPQIVYISCNPKTLVKNLVQFTESGYEVKYVKPYDNFPMTRHVETVVLLSRKAD